MVIHWNCLDSKYQKPNWNNTQNRYGRDWCIEYDGSRDINYRIIIKELTPEIIHDSVSTSEQGKEFKMWKLLYNEQNPFAQDFYVRTTPFPVNPNMLYNNVELRSFVVGTKITFDMCFDNTGTFDRIGYNTYKGGYNLNPPENYYANPPIPPGNNVQGFTFVTPAYYYQNYDPFERIYGTKITARQNDSVIIKDSRRVWISGYQDEQLINHGDTIIFSTGSFLIRDRMSELNACRGGTIIDSGAVKSNLGGYCNYYIDQFSELGFYGEGEHVIYDSSRIYITANARLKIGDNTTLTFDGPQCCLYLFANSSVSFGNNAKIQFKNGARLEADGCNFTQIASGKTGTGLYFENYGDYSFIKNSYFSNLSVPISIYNSSSNNKRINIIKNDFNNIGVRCIMARNLYKSTIDSNILHLPNGGVGLLLQNYYALNESESEDIAAYELNITNNKVYNGYIGMFVGGYASDLINAFISYNRFENTSGGWGLALRQVNGTVKNTYINTNSYYYAMGLWNSAPSLLNNNINNSINSDIYLSGSAPSLSPARGQNNMYWTGGSNYFTSSSKDNIHINSGYPYVEQGLNYFTIQSNAGYHMYGYLTTSNSNYNISGNCWFGNGNTAKCLLFYGDPGVPITIINQPNTNCGNQINYLGYNLVQLSDSTYDTVYYSEDNTGIPVPEDEALYSSSVLHAQQGNHFEAILDLKGILNNYINSSYKYVSLSDLYGYYEKIDTADQQHRDFIFSELKNYYNLLIQQYSSDMQFVNTAYNLVLMCETKIQNYNEALTGYEFISLYHPDPEARLQASMDYGEIQAFLNGMGGGEIRQPKVVNMLKVLKLMDKTPVGRIVKNAYKKMENLNKGNSDNDNPQNVKRANELKDRAKFNIANSRGLSRKERDQRRDEDIRLLIKYELVQSDNISHVPKVYSLSQNYPNPFNPVTKITYNIPIDSKVKLIVYDILGREIKRLINDELKLAGSYTIEFNGANLSSGVYFYRLESGDYTESKKMVLIK